MNRLNSAYADAYNNQKAGASLNTKRAAGANLLISTITNLTGLTINHYIQVDLLGFYRISNAIGGVTVNLCHAVNDTHAANQAAGLSGGSGLKLSKGKHTIQGVQALEFVRQRHFLPLGDLDRVRRQQYFLTAAFRKVASLDMLFKLASLGDALKRNVYIDGHLNLIDLATQMDKLSANNIVGRTIPNSVATINGMDVLQVRPAEVHALVERLINPPARTAAHHVHKPNPPDSKCIP
jgi:LCP family protein required for cell wall assembly